MTGVLGSEAHSVLRDSLDGRGADLRALSAWSVVQALPALLSGLLVARAIDHGFLARDTAQGLGWLLVLCVALLLGAWGRRQAYSHLAPIVEPFRDVLITRAVRGALTEAGRVGAAPDTGTVARVGRHIEIAREAYASVFMVVQGFAVTTVSALIGLLSLVPAVLIFVVPPLFAGLTLFLVVLNRTASRRRAALVAEERIAESTTALVGAARDVVAAGAEELVAADAAEAFEAQRQAAVDVARFTAVQTLAIAVGGWLPVVLILAFGWWLRGAGATTGIIVGSVAYVLQGVQPALQTLIRGLGSNGLWLVVALGRVLELVAKSSELSGPSAELRSARLTRPLRDRESMVTFRGVSFGYGPEPVIDNLDLIVPFGDHLAVVGPSGVGKSTFTLLLSGLLYPTRGDVLIDGHPAAGFDAVELAERRTLIPQEAYVFSGTLRENLAYLRTDISDREIENAVQVLGLGSIVEKVGGYGADPTRTHLSGGELQLIALARSYLSKAVITILDEAACHLDPAAEAEVERAFARRSGTLVVVAHRISSARRAKRILVMDGTRSFVGSDEQLTKESALYRDLVGHWSSSSSRSPRPRTACTSLAAIRSPH